MNIFLGMNILWIFFGVIPKWTSLRGFSMYIRVFSKGKYTESGYFLGCKNFKYFFGVLQISDIFWG